MATRIYKTPFAATGDKEALATADQPDGKVSLQSGWTPDYELPGDNPNYRPVGRQEMNGIVGEVTEGLGEVQLYGFAKWQAIDGGWPLGANVIRNETVYRSLIANNVSDPASGDPSWAEAMAGRLLAVKTYISSTTYDPTPGAKYARFKGVAPGGGSGGTLATGPGQAAASGAGSAGNHFDFFVMQGLTSMPITIGAAGAAGSSAPGNGGNGGDIVIGSIATIKGGYGGLAGNAQGTFPGLSGACQANAVSTISAVGTFGVLNGLGQTGVRGVVLGIVNILYSSGGNSAWGRGGTLDGAGAGIGGGGVGAGVGQNTPASPGFPGGAGIVVVEEYA
ncbi:hypothetical protein [Achromobacter arsenitoxydans]|uniref:Phage tail fiber protein n=1 Tax=Achromobacter arsenitoxydans SY8 TaxID=477184 RepID=H0F6U9_9BURK|nr:hypothetical protein [Achromobacter arsenitoxydans]EHK66007.1 phage tail fiber protein [Achromobacter arsenitoxydans SY8]